MFEKLRAELKAIAEWNRQTANIQDPDGKRGHSHSRDATPGNCSTVDRNRSDELASRGSSGRALARMTLQTCFSKLMQQPEFSFPP